MYELYENEILNRQVRRKKSPGTAPGPPSFVMLDRNIRPFLENVANRVPLTTLKSYIISRP